MSVVLWNIQDHISTLGVASDAKPLEASSGSSGGKQAAKASNNKVSESHTVGPRGVYRGHEDTVEDVQFCPSR